MNESSLNRPSADPKEIRFPVDRIDLVRTLRDLNSIEIDCDNISVELQHLRNRLRQKLPPEILAIHEKLRAEGKRSVAPRFANACTECSAEVISRAGDKLIAGIFVQCPGCGTLLYG
jgi:predicted  nucleic acid-binding Zn-ribbon protein